MKYPADQKAETHERIINAASRAFRQRGFDGLGIAELMQELGLTQGGFYRHFDSKEDLYSTAVARGLHQIAEQLVNIAKSAPDRQALSAVIEFYLSMGHLRDVGSGCVIAALGPEISRQPLAVRGNIDSAVQTLMDRLAPFLSGKTKAEKRRNAYLLISGMAGILMTARAMDNPETQEQLLKSARAFYVQASAKEAVS